MYRCCSNETPPPEAAGSSSRHKRCRDRAAAPCTRSRSPIGWALVSECPRLRSSAGGLANQSTELADFVDALEQPLELRGMRGRNALFAGQGMPSVAAELIKGPRYLIHQPVGQQHTDDEDNGEKVDGIADGRLDLQSDVALVHADMHAAGRAGDYWRRQFREVSKARERAVIDLFPILVVGGDLVGHARYEGMRDDRAFLVDDEDVGDAGDIDILVDDGLESGIVLTDDQIDVRVGNGARDRPAALLEVVGQLPVDGVYVECGGGDHDEPHEGKQAEQGLLIESSDLHCFAHASHSLSRNGAKWPSLTTL